MTPTTRPAARLVARAAAGAFATLLAVISLVALTAAPSSAADAETTWSVRPADTSHGAGRPNYTYGTAAGGTISDAVVVTNYSTDPLTLAIYAADGYTTSSGLLDLVPTGAESIDLGSWVTLDRSEITMAPGASVTVPFTIEIPADARPGDHSGGIVTSLRGTQEGTNLAVDRRLASRVNLRVGGAVSVDATVSDVRVTYDTVLSPVATSSAVVTYRLTNTGSVRMYAREKVSLAAPFAVHRVSTPSVDLPEVLPGSSLERRVVVDGALPLGQLTATVEVEPTGVGVSGAAQTVTGQSTAWALPWTWLGLLALVVAAAYLIARRGTPTSTETGSSTTPTTDLATISHGGPQ